jgi:hypothetical protein
MKLAKINSTSPLNTFGVTSGLLRVTDPCYEADTWCAGTLEGVKDGGWYAHVGYHKDVSGWGTRVAYLHIRHSDVQSHFDPEAEFDSTWENSGIHVGVDSGQAGFFIQALFEQVCESEPVKEKFYEEVCDMTGNEQSWGVHAIGVVSSTGYGDGSYDCLVRRVDGQIVEAMIVFIPEYEEELEGE